MPQVSLLLWRKMVAMHCFVWPPSLQLWSGRQAGRQAGGRAGRQTGRLVDKIQIFVLFQEFYIQPPVSVFLFLMLYYSIKVIFAL